MALLPTGLFSGYSLLDSGDAAPAAGIFIPLSSLSGLTAAEANATTGDGRKLVYELVTRIQSAYAALDTANRPARFSATVGTPTGISANVIRKTYTLSFDLEVTQADVANES